MLGDTTHAQAAPLSPALLSATRPLWMLDNVTLTLSPPDEAGLMLATDDFSLAAGVGPTARLATLDYLRDLAGRYTYLVENQHRAGDALLRELAAIRLRLVGEG